MKTAKPADWDLQPLPEQRTSIRFDRLFAKEEMQRIRRGLVPEVMEDKWFIYWAKNHLYMHRSWTGYCVYVVRFAAEKGGWRMLDAQVNRDPEQYRETSDDRDALMIPYLIDVLLLGNAVNFPSAGESPEVEALQAWSLVGRASLGEGLNES